MVSVAPAVLTSLTVMVTVALACWPPLSVTTSENLSVAPEASTDGAVKVALLWSAWVSVTVVPLIWVQR